MWFSKAIMLQGYYLTPIKLPSLAPNNARTSLLKQPLEPEVQSFEYIQGAFPLTTENKPQV